MLVVALLTHVLTAAATSPSAQLSALLEEAHTLRLEERLEEASASYEAAAKSHPDRAEPHFFLGLTSRSANQPEDALRHYRAALKVAPQLAEAHLNAASLCSADVNSDGRPAEALHHYRAALKLRQWPANVAAQAEYNAALAQSSLGQQAAAIRALRRSLRLEPGFEAASDLLEEMTEEAGSASADGAASAIDEAAVTEEEQEVGQQRACADLGLNGQEDGERCDQERGGRSKRGGNSSGDAQASELHAAAVELRRVAQRALSDGSWLAAARRQRDHSPQGAMEEQQLLVGVISDVSTLLARLLEF
jgi:Tfp pilus assembly protein PilF